MADLGISPYLPSTTTTAITKAGKIQDAAQQFEALLIGQILRSAHESGGGWLGEQDSSSDCATEFAEQHLAGILAKGGGLGLAGLIGRGLQAESQPANSWTPRLRGEAASPR